MRRGEGSYQLPTHPRLLTVHRSDTWWTIIPKKAALLIEMSTTILKGCIIDDLSGSRDVISHVTIQLVVVNFLRVVHCNHVSIWHHYRDMAPQSTCTQTNTPAHKHGTTERTNDQSLNLLQCSLRSPWQR